MSRRCEHVVRREHFDDTAIKHQIESCTAIKQVRVLKEIGSGATSRVYLANGYIRGRMNFVVKDELIGYTGDEDEMIEALNRSVDIATTFGKYNIGPKIYDSFYTFITNNRGNVVAINHYLIMEHYDLSAGDALIGLLEQGNVQRCVSLVKRVAYLLYNMIQSKVFCADIKLVNFLYREKDGDVKLTDFGSNFCTRNENRFSTEEQETLYLAVLLMVAEEVRQTTNEAVAAADITREDQKRIMGPLYENYVFSTAIAYSMKGKVNPTLINIKNLLENDYYGLGRTVAAYTGVYNLATLSRLVKQLEEFSPMYGFDRAAHFTER